MIPEHNNDAHIEDGEDYTVIFDHVSKKYKLGAFDHKSLRKDISEWVSTRLGTPTNNEMEEDIIWALKDVDFKVKRGECLGIIGKNGSGKSTALKLIAGLTEPTSGHVYTKGRIASLLEVGTGFHPELTGRENVFLNAAILGMSIEETTKKLDQIIAFSEIERFIDTPVKRYSSGMRVRLAFSVAVHVECDILLIDEVLAVGDRFFRKKSQDRLKELILNEGITAILVSHGEQSILELCNRVILLENGKVKENTKPAEVFKSYVNTELLKVDNKGDKSISTEKGLVIHSPYIQQELIEEQNHIRQGREFRLILTIENHATHALSLYLLGVIRSELYGKLGYFGNRYQSHEVTIEPNSIKQYEIIVSALFLPVGEYSLTLYVDHQNDHNKKPRYVYKDFLRFYIHEIDPANDTPWHTFPEGNNYGFVPYLCRAFNEIID